MPTSNYTIFIIFGIVDKTEKATLSLLMLNVTDPLNITLNDKYEKNPSNSNNSPDFSQESYETKPSSQGRTIGIAVGVTVAVSYTSQHTKKHLYVLKRLI